jgi:hypothetical protein
MHLLNRSVFIKMSFARLLDFAVFGWRVAVITLPLLLTAGCGTGEQSQSAADKPASEKSVPTPQRALHEGSLCFERDEVDCGEVKGKLNHAFRFENTGKETVRIDRLQPSCNCSGVKASAMTISPGVHGEIAVNIDLEKQSRGRHQYTVLVEYSDPRPRKAVLVVEAFNSPELTIVPREIELVSYDRQSVAARCVVIDYKKVPLEITEIASSVPWLRAKIVAKPLVFSNGWTHELEVSVIGEDVPGQPHTEKVLLRTNDPKKPTLEIPVRVASVDRVAAAPDSVRFWSRSAKGELAAHVTIRDREGSNLVIESVASSSPDVKTEWEKAAEDVAPYRTVSLRWVGPTMRDNQDKIQVRIKLRKPCEREISVGVAPPQF